MINTLIKENEAASSFIESSNKGMGLDVNPKEVDSNIQARQSFTERSIEGGVTTTKKSRSPDTSSTFWGDVMEGMSASGGSASIPSAGGAPSGGAPSIFRASPSNIAHILKMFSPYQ
ncbi:TPA: hypothetical protein NJ597_001225 [Vibrio parahaemolyticus]|nr:hypothetical protein [Vibrio parahaemolyticus]